MRSVWVVAARDPSCDQLTGWECMVQDSAPGWTPDSRGGDATLVEDRVFAPDQFEAALAWARAQASVVLVRPPGEGWQTAGESPPSWDAGMVAFEH
jgi:hypothetical protein